jgi:4'-phosphopantetheinyl transferase
MKADVYRMPPDDLALPPGEIHVWQAFIAPRNDWDSLERTLSADERLRAERFHFDADRQRSIAARGILRRLLGQYLRVAPTELAFRYGPQGKPELAAAATASVSFNLAHSGDLAMYAFARDRRLGIDVERLREVPEAQIIARNHFTPAESRQLRPPGAGLQASFFRLWTRKEAVIKAVGTGVSTPLDEFDVSSAAPIGTSWQRVGVPSQPRPEWYVCDLPAAAGYCAALAVEARFAAAPPTEMQSPEQPARLRLWREGD